MKFTVLLKPNIQHFATILITVLKTVAQVIISLNGIILLETLFNSLSQRMELLPILVKEASGDLDKI